MFTNCNCFCMGNCYMPNQNLYLQMENLTPYALFFTIQYTVHGESVGKKSLTFNPSKKTKLLFSPDAQNIRFKVFKAARTSAPLLICNGALPNAASTCYQVLMTPSQFKCVQVSC